MSAIARIRKAFAADEVRLEIVTMAVDFLREAAVLVAVLGILEAAVARGGPPSGTVLRWSLGGGFTLFAAACMIRALQVRS